MSSKDEDDDLNLTDKDDEKIKGRSLANAVKEAIAKIDTANKDGKHYKILQALKADLQKIQL